MPNNLIYNQAPADDLLPHPYRPVRTNTPIVPTPTHQQIKTGNQLLINNEWIEKVVAIPEIRSYAIALLQGTTLPPTPDEHHDITEIKNILETAIQNPELRAHLITALQNDTTTGDTITIQANPSKKSSTFKPYFVLIAVVLVGLVALVKKAHFD